MCVAIFGVSEPFLSYDVSRMFLQHVLGGATACSAGTHAAVRTGAYVILLMGPAGVDWAGWDPAVIQVHVTAGMGGNYKHI